LPFPASEDKGRLAREVSRIFVERMKAHPSRQLLAAPSHMHKVNNWNFRGVECVPFYRR